MWDPVKKQEEDYLRPRLAQIDQLKGAVGLATRCMTLRNQPGYADFVKLVQDIHDAALSELVDSTGDSATVHVLQGKVQAFKNILHVMKNTENQRDALAVQLKAAQDEVATMVDANGRAATSKAIWR